MTNLATLRDRVEIRLADVANDIWSADALDNGIRQAAHEYSQVLPRQTMGTVTLAANGREVDISSLSDVLVVQRVWSPYTASAPEYPPNWRRFEWWRDSQVIYFPDGYEPSSGDVVRVFYGTLHILADLDGAVATSFNSVGLSMLELGAAGFAAQTRALDLEEQVTLGRQVTGRILAWGNERVAEFKAWLMDEAGNQAAQGQSRIETPKDKWARRGRGWV